MGRDRFYLTTQKRYNGKLWDETSTYKNFKEGNDLAAKFVVSAATLPYAMNGTLNFFRGFKEPISKYAFNTALGTAALTGLVSGAGHGFVDGTTRTLTASPENNYEGYTFPQWIQSFSVDPNAETIGELIHPGTLLTGIPLSRINQQWVQELPLNIQGFNDFRNAKKQEY